MSYKTIVGLEIHVELATKTKAFCSCENSFGGEPNTRVCPVCMGMPGALPVLNEEVVHKAIEAATAFHMTIHPVSRFQRKNYFYPDLTKGYQITQNHEPIANDGYLEIDTEAGPKKIRIAQLQMEEDTGKSLHSEETNTTLMDYNRCGVPLIEIVSQPDMSSAEEARKFLDKLRKTLKVLGVSDVKMAEGSLRCDVNINLKNEQTGERSSIAEIKNLNSFRAVVRAIEFEEARQQKLMEAGEEEVRTTRRWDDVANETVVMRYKYTANDYRFAPEGDLGPVFVDEAMIQSVVEGMNELPDVKLERFQRDYGLSPYDAGVLTERDEIARFFEEVAAQYEDYNSLANWISGEVLRRVDTDDEEITIGLRAEDLAYLLRAIDEKKISNNAGKKVLRILFEEGGSPAEIIQREGLEQVSDTGAIEKVVVEIVAQNPESVTQWKNGKDRVLGFLVGQVMKATKGKANPQMANELLRRELEKQ
ncbi:MAG: Asp-tRNA(Asn)/Glu-tRNA(Gln) amidotransferase subunit GatB [Tissierellia bacterium]|nr:Asp-tRNA(Asn)/Glu-tRNA(Gln) amidotransferase subunit GatB [Tissierellia bacterium]